MYNTVLVKDKGIEVLKQMLLPIPLYNVDTVIGYYRDSETAIESRIVGYHISVFPTDLDKDTVDSDTLTYEYDIQYQLANGDIILEDIIDYHYD